MVGLSMNAETDPCVEVSADLGLFVYVETSPFSSSPPVELEVWCSTASSGSARAAVNLENAKRINAGFSSDHPPSHISYLFIYVL